jgi:hypothetical protein
MLRSLVALAAVGVAGIVVWKLVWVLLLPMVFGLLALAIKFALIGALVYVLYRVFKSATRPRAEPS